MKRQLTLYWYFMLVLYSSPLTIIIAEDCVDLAAQGDCSFYRKCVETKMYCGDNGYAINYGERYCKRFEEYHNCFNIEGCSWIKSVQSCLMSEILDSDPLKHNGTCTDLKEFGFNAHSGCFSEHGFCTDILLSFKNLQCLQTVYSSTDLFTREGIAQQYEAGKECSLKTTDEFLDNAAWWLQIANEGLQQHLKIFIDFFGVCTSTIDLLVVMDASGSVGADNFTIAKSFVVNLTMNFNIGSTGTHVGVIRFSTLPKIIIPLGSILTLEELVNAINNIYYTRGRTWTHLALDTARSVLGNSTRASEGIPRVVLLITDGRSNKPDLTELAAGRVHSENINVYSFGIGNTDENELNIIASDPRYVYYIDDFDQASFDAVLRPLQQSTCRTSAVVDISQPLKNSIAKGQSRYLEYRFPVSEGFTVEISVSDGELSMYASFSIPNPNLLTADFELTGINASIHYYISPDMYHNSVYDSAGTIVEQQLLYLTLSGLEERNTFFLNTTLGNMDTTPSPNETGVYNTTEPPSTAAVINAGLVMILLLFVLVLTMTI